MMNTYKSYDKKHIFIKVYAWVVIVIVCALTVLAIFGGYAVQKAWASGMFAVNIAPVDRLAKISDTDSHDGVKLSVESVFGGNDTLFARIKMEFDDIILDDSYKYSFGLCGIVWSLNPADSDKHVINGGGNLVHVGEENQTNVRYFDLELRAMYDSDTDFSLGDGQERVISVTDIGYYDEDYEWVVTVPGEWLLKFSYTSDNADVNIIFEPFMFYGKGLEGSDRLAEMTAIKLNSYGLDCRYTAYEAVEAIYFETAVILKDGTRMTFERKSAGCTVNMQGFLKIKFESALDLEEVAYVQIGDILIEVEYEY